MGKQHTSTLSVGVAALLEHRLIRAWDSPQRSARHNNSSPNKRHTYLAAAALLRHSTRAASLTVAGGTLGAHATSAAHSCL